MMGKKAMEAAQFLVDSLQLEGKLTAADFLVQREKALDALFPSAQLMPGSCCLSARIHQFVCEAVEE